MDVKSVNAVVAVGPCASPRYFPAALKSFLFDQIAIAASDHSSVASLLLLTSPRAGKLILSVNAQLVELLALSLIVAFW